MAALLAACGGSSSDSNEPAGTYQVQVTKASFPSQPVRRPDLADEDRRPATPARRRCPALTVTVNIEGKEGETAQIPFSVHDAQPGLANGDRPVWVLSATYPRLAGSSAPGRRRRPPPRRPTRSAR